MTYNLRKVEGESARIISSHRMIAGITDSPGNIMQKTLWSFDDYLSANRRTEKPILHISLNPSPEDRLTDAGFAALAADYMEKIGYGDQPYLVFMHEDTGRRHIHIVSICVDETGRKISDAYEWRRSMQACRELEQKYGLKQVADERQETTAPALKKVEPRAGDLKKQVANTLTAVLSSYKFQSFGEYSALLSCFNIEAKLVRGEHEGTPYTGVVYTALDRKGNPAGPPFKSSLLGKRFGHEGLTRKMNRHTLDYKNRKWGPDFHDKVRLAILDCDGKQKKFGNLMRGHGIDVVFRTTGEGRIYGVTFIDHASREVCNGSRLGKEFSANSFQRLFNDPAPAQNIRHSAPEHLHHEDKESALEQIFGIFHTPEEEFVPPEDLIKRKKKKKKKRGHSI